MQRCTSRKPEARLGNRQQRPAGSVVVGYGVRWAREHLEGVCVLGQDGEAQDGLACGGAGFGC